VRAAALLLVGWLLAVPALAAPPTDTGLTLAGTETTFAALVSDARTVVVISFERDQTDSMLASFDPLERLAAKTGAAWAVTPVLPSGIRALRRLIDGGIRKKVPLGARHARTATFYLDKDAFTAALGIPSEDELAVLVFVDGKVTWRGTGPLTPTMEAEIQAFLSQPAPAPGPDPAN
jgi:hypothetical protein